MMVQFKSLRMMDAERYTFVLYSKCLIAGLYKYLNLTTNDGLLAQLGTEKYDAVGLQKYHRRKQLVYIEF